MNDGKVYNENFDCRVSERDVILKVMTVTMKHMEEKLGAVNNEKRLLERAIEYLRRK